MRKLIIFLIILSIYACKSGKTTHEEHDHEIQIKEHSEKVSASDSVIFLDKTQLSKAGITLDSIRKRKIRIKLPATGTIEAPPQNKATLFAPMEAFVHETKLLPGDRVEKGQIVAILEHSNFIDLQYSYLEALHKLQVSTDNYERKKMLYHEDIASKKSFVLAKANYVTTKNLVESFASKLRITGISVERVKKNGIQQYVYVKSPISGFVVENNLNKGKFLAANFEMMEIIDNDHMHAELNLFGTDISKVEKGDIFMFTPSGLNLQYNGYIQLISQKIDAKTKTVNLHGHFEDPKGRLKSGMFIQAEIYIEQKMVCTLPEEAIVTIGSDSFIFVYTKDNNLEKCKVTIGARDSGFVEILAVENHTLDLLVAVRGTQILKGILKKESGEMHGHAH